MKRSGIRERPAGRKSGGISPPFRLSATRIPQSYIRATLATEIEPAPSFGAKIRADFIQGMGKVGGEFVIILDLDKVLSVEEMAALTGGAA